MVVDFLRKASEDVMDEKKRRDDGMAQRRKVLGNAWVDKSIANASRSTPTSRTSSPAPPGAKSGPGRISTSAHGAFW